jgi:D-amino-acid dehydrogenase
MKNVVVIGGGVIGLASAWYLHQSGHRVTVLDKDGFQDNCSYGNLGFVCPSHFIPMAAPGIVWQGLKWMLNSKSPFYVQPSFDHSLLDWGLKFVKSATEKNVKRAAIPLRDIAIFSQSEYLKLSTYPELDLSFEKRGMLEIFRTKKVRDHAGETVAAGKEIGLDVDLLDAAQLQSIEQQTHIDALGAIYFKGDSHLYPDKLMSSLKKSLQEKGVQLIKGEMNGFGKRNRVISSIETTEGTHTADEIVVATGSWSRSVAAIFDTKIPLMPGRGYSFTLEDSPYKLNRPVILIEGRVAITPMDGNKMRFGGTMEIVKIGTPPRFHRIKFGMVIDRPRQTDCHILAA